MSRPASIEQPQKTYTYSNLPPKLLNKYSGIKLLKEEDLICPVTCAFVPNSLDACLVGRGPYIQSYPLFHHDHDCDYDENDFKCATNETNNNKIKSELTQKDKINGFRHKVFDHDSGSVHGLRFLHLSSSSENSLNIGLAFGGRHIAFFHTDYKNNIQPVLIQRKINSTTTFSSSMQCLDWIWDATMLSTTFLNRDDTIFNSNMKTYEKGEILASFMLGLAYMNNSCEIWKIDIISKSQTNNEELVLYPHKFKKINCEVRCITYAMCFFGWSMAKHDAFTNPKSDTSHDAQKQVDTSNIGNKCDDDNNTDLIMAAGTVFNEILIWKVLSSNQNKNCTITTFTCGPTITAQVTHRLTGHEGVIFKIQIHETMYGEQYIASTSDDRTVRLWKQTKIITRCKSETSDNDINDENPTYTYEYIPQWIGWGHTARIWDVTFTPYGILTSGEDGTARLWHVHSGKQVMELRGHVCQSIWGVVTDPQGQIAVTLGNDACVKVWDLASHIILNRVNNLNDFVDVNTNVMDNDNDNCDENIGYGMDIALLPLDNNAMDNLENDRILLSQNAVDNGNDTSMNEKKIDRKNKKKKSGKAKVRKQIIAGMSFYQKHDNQPSLDTKVIFATRTGSLFSYNLISKKWEFHEPWFCSETDVTNDNLMPSMPSFTHSKLIPIASCLAIHPTGDFVAVGTTGKHVIVSPIVNTPSETMTSNYSPLPLLPQRIAFEAPSPYYSIQKLAWLNENELIAFHIKGILILWRFSFNSKNITKKAKIELPHVHMILHMACPHNGVPMSYDYDQDNNRLIVGDSRGNLAVFDFATSSSVSNEQNNDFELQKPLYIFQGAHKKEHITSIVYSHHDNLILSVGNDGVLHEWTLPSNKNNNNDRREINTESVMRHKRLSLPISSLTALTHVWLVPHNGDADQSIIVGGYYGHKYMIFDVTRKYVLLQVHTGGRQRINDIWVNFKNSGFHFPYQHAFVFCVARNDGRNELHVHRLLSSLQDINHISTKISTKKHSIDNAKGHNSLQYSLGNSYHGETVNDACWCETSMSNKVLLLSGSNDCTVRLSIFENGLLSCVKDLPPHESCVRAVTSSRHPGSSSSLLVTCGGKLSMNFYLYDEGENITCENTSGEQMNLPVHFLCSNRHLRNKYPITIDHRINVVKSIPFLSYPGMHLVFSGDSNGTFQLIVIHADFQERNPIFSNYRFSSNSRPILCLDVVDLTESILVFIGNSAGEICVWEINDVSYLCPNHKTESDIRIPSSPLLVYKAHQMGTNGLSAKYLPNSIGDRETKQIKLVVCSGGDDQAITITTLLYERDSSASITIERCIKMNEASSSAIKAVQLVKEKTTNDLRLYTVGYDQRLALWKVDANSKDPQKMLFFLSSSYAHVADISGLACITLNEKQGSSKELCVVVGEGAHVFSLDPNIPLAAKVLRDTNFLLITAGAGASSDSGLVTYDTMPTKYREMCNPHAFVEQLEHFQEYWLNFARLYSRTNPHKGYSILNEWCDGGMLANLCRDMQMQSPWWIYTSNVDGHFRRYKSFNKCICEIHGSANEFRCASATGFHEEEERRGGIWKEWNRKVNESVKNQCSNSVFTVDHMKNSSPLTCKHCNLPVRPNVLMFHDTDVNILRSIQEERQRYQAWEEQIENEVVQNGKNLVIIEVGAGISVPAVRIESEEVFFDCLGGLKSKYEENSGEVRKSARVALIRINPKNAEIKHENKDIFSTTISIPDTSLQALEKINNWIKVFNNG